MRTGQPASARCRAATKPSPPLLPGPHSTATGRAGQRCPISRATALPAFSISSSRCTGGHRQTIGFAHPADIEQRSLEVHDSSVISRSQLRSRFSLQTCANSRFARNATSSCSGRPSHRLWLRLFIASSKLDFFMSRCVLDGLPNRCSDRSGEVRHQDRVNRHPNGQSTKECQGTIPASPMRKWPRFRFVELSGSAWAVAGRAGRR